jgi:hypothetical protein
VRPGQNAHRSGPTGVVSFDVHSDDGLALLPDPSPGDLFFDFEGDPFFSHGEGLEYLIGAVEPALVDSDEPAGSSRLSGLTIEPARS